MKNQYKADNNANSSNTGSNNRKYKKNDIKGVGISESRHGYIYIAIKLALLALVPTLIILSSFLYSVGPLSKRKVTLDSSQSKGSWPTNKEIKLKFNKPVRMDNLPTILPSTEGKWSINKSTLGVQEIVFKPAKSMYTDAKYMIAFNDVKDVSGIKKFNISYINLKTQKSPEIKDFSLEKTQIGHKSKITIKLSAPNNNLKDYRLVVDNTIELHRSNNNIDDEYYFEDKNNVLLQDKEYRFDLYDLNYNKGPMDQYVTSNSLYPSKNLVRSIISKTLPSTSFTMNRNRDIKPGDEIVITPSNNLVNKNDINFVCINNVNCMERARWDGDLYKFSVSATINPGIRYNIEVRGSGLTDAGTSLPADYRLEYISKGNITYSFSGATIETEQNTDIIINFSAPVIRDSINNRISVNGPGSPNLNTAWISDSKLNIRLSNLELQSNYTINISPGIAPVGFGLPAIGGRLNIGTKYPSKLLNVPFIRQQYALSCESAALRMALAYYGADPGGDMAIMNVIGYQPQAKDKNTNIWQDPYQMFVGDVNASQYNETGYGVYAGPIARAAGSFGHRASIGGGNLNSIANDIYNGNPVVVWGGAASKILNWQTSDGRSITGWVGEHTITVYGVKGRADNPIGFFARDPARGNVYFSTAGLAGWMSTPVGRQHVTVY